MRHFKRRALLWVSKVAMEVSLWCGRKVVEDVERETREPHWMGR